MSEPRAELARCRRLVVKIGSRLLAESPAGRPAALADQIHALRQRGVEVVVVSSGAIALGVRALALPGRPSELPQLQAAAAAGQSRLMQHWEHAFSVHGTVIGQVLLTHDDLGDRRRFLSARQTLRALLDLGAVPIINENDTVATDEIKFGDNDQLAALVCNLVSADLLVILTDVEGVRGTDGVRMPIVVDIDREAAPAARAGRGDGVGSGGMASKVPAGDTLSSRKHWIAYGAKPAGRLTVDAGAARAVCEHGRSLLPAGITAVEGGFGMGETVAVVGADGRELARGLTAYDADDLRKILGLSLIHI